MPKTLGLITTVLGIILLYLFNYNFHIISVSLIVIPSNLQQTIIFNISFKNFSINLFFFIEN